MSEKLHYKYKELIKSMVEYVGGVLTDFTSHGYTHVLLSGYSLGVWEYSRDNNVSYYCLCVYKRHADYNVYSYSKAVLTDDPTRNLIQYMWASVWKPAKAHPTLSIDINPW